ncbi:MAG TPA: hypothetical protein V6D20_15275, partial [Candidatus Obscuribacterales bacterium]
MKLSFFLSLFLLSYVPGSVLAQCGASQAITIAGDLGTVTSILPPTNSEVDVVWEISNDISLELSAETFDHLQAVNSSATITNGVLSLDLSFSPVPSSAFTLSVGAFTFALVALLADQRVALGMAFIGSMALVNSQMMCQNDRYLVTIHAPANLQVVPIPTPTRPIPTPPPVDSIPGMCWNFDNASQWRYREQWGSPAASSTNGGEFSWTQSNEWHQDTFHLVCEECLPMLRNDLTYILTMDVQIGGRPDEDWGLPSAFVHQSSYPNSL